MCSDMCEGHTTLRNFCFKLCRHRWCDTVSECKFGPTVPTSGPDLKQIKSGLLLLRYFAQLSVQHHSVTYEGQQLFMYTNCVGAITAYSLLT